jgi:hypothetical protein
MIFKVRPDIIKQFDTIHNFGIKNLIVSGCSFTYNLDSHKIHTWPYFLRDLGGFDQVLDTSLPGAGNFHIANSLIWALELERPDPKNTLVIVMWSGNDRDDYMTPATNINNYPWTFNYSKNVMSAITGGSHAEACGNTTKSAKNFFASKTQESRSIENYLCITNTWNYLQNKGYRFVFLNFLNPDFPSRISHFDIKKYLPLEQKEMLIQMMDEASDLYSFVLKNNFLSEDDLHPSSFGHMQYTKNILIPYLKTKFC